MSTPTPDDWFAQWYAAMPESKLELIDGKLIIGTLAGSRRILWEILQDYGPDMVLPMAPTEFWWTALQEAYNLIKRHLYEQAGVPEFWLVEQESLSPAE